jgi:succinate dehydrogenase / fumarate reductase, cytochrome b subunit
MARPGARPLSPHLFERGLKLHYRWGPHMLVSILHRATGTLLALAGTAIFVWWLAALAGGPDSYAVFRNWVIQRADDTHVLPGIANGAALVAAIGLSWAFFQHLANGVRHLFMDMGAGFELKRTKATSIAAIVFALVATAVLWTYIFAVKGGV